MANKIIIDYSAQPLTDGTGFSYTITVDGYDIIYNSGETECNIQYIPRFDIPANINELGVGEDLAHTLQITLSYLRYVFVNSLVSYEIVGNTIEVTVNSIATITINPTTNDNISLTQQEIPPVNSNLIYYLYFDNYTLNIYKENFLGNPTEIFGSFKIKKSSVENVLDPIRGTGLDLALEANQALTFDEFILNKEFTYKTELLKGGQTVFEGYIKPDGTQQSYVNDIWLVNIESSDGLGALKDLSFVQTNGLHFVGKISFYDVIKACLDRTRLDMVINTSISIEYNGYTGDNILKDVYVNSERFIKNSNDPVIMDCNEVLTSILNLFSGVITQQDGQWWIYRPTDLVTNGYTTFINQSTDIPFTKNLNKSLGSQIDNFYPHHCDANQQIEVKGAISAYRLNYQYGFLDGFLDNPNLNHDIDLVYDNWTVNPSLPSGVLINNPQDTSGLLMRAQTASIPLTLLEVSESDSLYFDIDTILTFQFKVSTQYQQQVFFFQIKTDDGYYLNNDYKWTTTEKTIALKCGKSNTTIYNANIEIKAQPLLSDSNVSIIIYRPVIFQSLFPYPGIGEVQFVQVIDTTLTSLGIVGENHTVTRYIPPSSITKENQQVFNGDGGQELIGSIYKEDLETVTENWNRIGKFEQLPILGISAMDDLRVQANAIKVFSGSVFGEIPYLSVVTINNIVGLFQFTEYDYDYKSNKSNVKLTQFYNTDIADIQYEVSPDYGNNTIKPTIVG